MEPVESMGDASFSREPAQHAWMQGARRWLRRTGVGAQLLSLALIVAVFAIGTRGASLSWDNVQVVLSLAAIPAILAVGLHLTIVIGGIDLSLQGTVALCAVFVGVLSKNRYNEHDVGLWILPICLAIGGAAGMLTGVLHTKLRIPSFITTLGVSWVLYGVAVYVNKAMLITLLDNRIQNFINDKPLGVANVVLVALAIVIAVQFFEDRTRTGRYLYAIGGDEALARQAGVNVPRMKVIAFAIAGCLYGLGALLLVSRMGSATARTGLNLLFPVITAVAVGGVSLTGGLGGAKNALLGTLVLAVLNNGMVLMAVNPYAQTAVNGIVLIVAVALTLDRRKLGFIK
ncbi:Monosaccharide ABC transporter membrane protein (CUT2 family) [Paraburkholderia tropica]|uniref:ABC transporter permease n=1 Tax=Paraburkholderia tropica TaxID=92647 RepID=UPI001CB463D5|nr:ABC transporter permease [Paraburkholderia tropica]CAG9222805.1 Monosaccharide ABC transporter membrane protein (CUT2 family) [Paraburkholderia tropica]